MQIGPTLRCLLAATAAVLPTQLACNEATSDPEEEEYIPNSNPNSIDPFCKWEEDPTPEGEGLIAHRIGRSVLLEERAICGDFEAGEIDGFLIEEYLSSVVEDCNPEPFELLRGCFELRDDRCAFTAYFFSPCELSTSS